MAQQPQRPRVRPAQFITEAEFKQNIEALAEAVNSLADTVQLVIRDLNHMAEDVDSLLEAVFEMPQDDGAEPDEDEDPARFDQDVPLPRVEPDVYPDEFEQPLEDHGPVARPGEDPDAVAARAEAERLRAEAANSITLDDGPAREADQGIG